MLTQPGGRAQGDRGAFPRTSSTLATDHADTIVIGNAAPEFRDVPKRLTDGQTIIDLVRITDSRSVSGVYEGICW